MLVETAEVQLASNLEGVFPVLPAVEYSSSHDEQLHTTQDTEDIVQVLNVEQGRLMLAGSSKDVIREQAPHQSHGSDNVDTRCSASSHWCWRIFFLAILLIIAAVVVSVALVIVGNKKASYSPVVIIVPTANNTVDDGYLQEIHAILVPPNLWGNPTAAELLAV